MLNLISNNILDNTCCQTYESSNYTVDIFYKDDVLESVNIVCEDFFAPTINIAVANGKVTSSTINIAATGSLNSLKIMQHIQKVALAHEIMLATIERIKKGKNTACANL